MIADYMIARGEQDIEKFLHEKLKGLYRYLMAGDGIYIQAARPGLGVSFQIADAEVRGLPMGDSFVNLTHPRVPLELTRKILNRSREVCVNSGRPVEALFYLRCDHETGEWQLHEPKQHATGGSVHPDDSTGEAYADALIELHSHHQMDAFWSGTDNADEQGFRLYAVLGEIFTNPTLRVRVGCFGYFYEVAASGIFELPGGLTEREPEQNTNGQDDLHEDEEDKDGGGFIYRVGPFHLK